MNNKGMVDWHNDGYSSLTDDSQLSGFLFFQSKSQIHPHIKQSDMNSSLVSKVIFEQFFYLSREWHRGHKKLEGAIFMRLDSVLSGR